VKAESLAARLGLEDGFLQGDGVRLHYAAGGNGPLILFLHGFPEFWYSWRHQLREFSSDRRAVALDLRGYNDSDRPVGRRAYRMVHLVADIRAAIEQLNGRPAVLVGHDWGGAVAWAFADRHPGMLERLVIVNAPHPARFLQEVRRPPQMLKSWYMFAFQLPVIPEWLMTRRGAAALEPTYRKLAANPQAFSDEDIRLFREAFVRPGTASAAVNYYRNLLHARAAGRAGHMIDVPTLLLWGDRDPYLDIRVSRGHDRYVANLTVRHLADAGHFVHQERPEEVNRELRAFLGL